MNKSRKLWLCRVLVCLLVTPVCISAQRIFPLTGGTATESHPLEKKQIVLVAENSDIKLSLGRSEKFNPKRGDIWVFWMRIQNKKNEPVLFDPAKINAIDSQGKAVSGLAPEVAIKRFNDSIAGVMNVVGNVVAGPLAGPSMIGAQERESTQRLNRDSLQLGEIPPLSYKEGMVFIEATKIAGDTIRVTLTGLWKEPIIFTTDSDKQLKSPKNDK